MDGLPRGLMEGLSRGSMEGLARGSMEGLTRGLSRGLKGVSMEERDNDEAYWQSSGEQRKV